MTEKRLSRADLLQMLIEDWTGQEEGLGKTVQKVSRIYRRYALLTPEAKERVINREKLMDLRWIWDGVALAKMRVARTVDYNADMLTKSALFMLYTRSGDNYYTFDGNGNAVPIRMDASGVIVADVETNTFSDFLPFNSPDVHTNGHEIVNYDYDGDYGEYAGVTHDQYDAKFQGDGQRLCGERRQGGHVGPCSRHNLRHQGNPPPGRWL